MKKKAIVCLLSALILLLSSCGSSQGSLLPPETDETEESSAQPESTTSEPVLTPGESEQELLRIIEAGKRFVSEMQNGIEPTGKSDSQLGDAREAFARYLKLETLYVSGAFIDPNTPETYTCIISGYNAYNYPRSADINFKKSESMEWFCSMVHYYRISVSMLEYYLEFLRNSDADGLAVWLGMDGPPSEAIIDSAKDTLAYYQSWCDLSELTIRENEYDLSFDVYVKGFVYTIEDAKGNTFQVETRIGDGQCFPLLKNRYY